MNTSLLEIPMETDDALPSKKSTITLADDITDQLYGLNLSITSLLGSKQESLWLSFERTYSLFGRMQSRIEDTAIIVNTMPYWKFFTLLRPSERDPIEERWVNSLERKHWSGMGNLTCWRDPSQKVWKTLVNDSGLGNSVIQRLQSIVYTTSKFLYKNKLPSTRLVIRIKGQWDIFLFKSFLGPLVLNVVPASAGIEGFVHMLRVGERFLSFSNFNMEDMLGK